MAQIKEEMIVIKVSSLIRDKAGVTADVFSDDLVDELEHAISALVGSEKVVEILRDLDA